MLVITVMSETKKKKITKTSFKTYYILYANKEGKKADVCPDFLSDNS